jgi:hypothetical protein
MRNAAGRGTVYGSVSAVVAEIATLSCLAGDGEDELLDAALLENAAPF